MSDINDGGPAFPTPPGTQYNDGMSLRDWFAGKAMQTLLADPECKEAAHALHINTERYVALSSYEIADAMIAAREEYK